MLKLKIENGTTKISFHKISRLNYLFADPFREQLVGIVSEPGREVVLSMKGINFIDSSGLEAIMTVVNRASEMGSRFRICNVSDDVYELLKLMKVKIMFEINPVKAREHVPAV
jgi:anti-sigma B factor antagonist